MNKIGIIGLGRVGLPYAVLMAKAGFKVVGFEIDSNLEKRINAGKSPFHEPHLQEYLSDVIGKNFRSTLDPKMIIDCDVIMIFVNTDINEGKPDLKALVKCIKTVGKYLRKGQLVILKSTVPPGTTERLVKPMLEKISGLTASDDFYLAYSLERGAEGSMINDILQLPAVIGGDRKSAELAAQVLKKVTRGAVIVSSATTAEAAKIFSNVYLDLNYALGNEIARYCEEIGIDAWETIAAANEGFTWKVKIRSPSPGVGGLCLPKDTYYVSTQKQMPLCLLARQINDEMPNRFVGKIEEAFKRAGKKILGSKILILGLAFKANVNDVRFSPSGIIANLLKSKGAEVVGHDPFVTSEDAEKFIGVKLVSLAEGFKDADCVAVVTNHDAYKSLDLDRLLPLGNDPMIIVDGWNILRQLRADKDGVIYRCVGVGRK